MRVLERRRLQKMLSDLAPPKYTPKSVEAVVLSRAAVSFHDYFHRKFCRLNMAHLAPTHLEIYNALNEGGIAISHKTIEHHRLQMAKNPNHGIKKGDKVQPRKLTDDEVMHVVGV